MKVAWFMLLLFVRQLAVGLVEFLLKQQSRIELTDFISFVF